MIKKYQDKKWLYVKYIIEQLEAKEIGKKGNCDLYWK